MRPARCLSALSLLLILAAPASAGHGGMHPTFATRTVYFHCTGDTPIYNVNWLQQVGASSAYARWDASPPAGSVADGEGCGAADVGWVTNEVYDPVFEGTFVGNLRDMTIRISDVAFNNEREPGVPVGMRIYAEIDGVPLFPRGVTEGAYDGRAFTVTPVRENLGATDKFEFTVTNIGTVKEIKDEAGNVVDVQMGGAVQEDGNGATEHTIKILLGLDAFPGEEPQAAGGTIWAWDSKEVPSGITFNPPTPASAKVKADLPDLR